MQTASGFEVGAREADTSALETPLLWPQQQEAAKEVVVAVAVFVLAVVVLRRQQL